MELKRNEVIKVLKQDRKEDTPNERLMRIHMYRDLKSKKRDKATLIVLTAIGLMIAIYAPKELSRLGGIGIMFICSILSILV